MYVQAATHINTYDLYQLGQVSMFFASRHCVQYVPTEFWSESLQGALEEALQNLAQFKEQLDTRQYIADLSKCLVSFGLLQIVSPLFAGTVEHTLQDLISTADCKSTENILFYLHGTSQNK
jgi:hypothetical protein